MFHLFGKLIGIAVAGFIALLVLGSLAVAVGSLLPFIVLGVVAAVIVRVLFRAWHRPRVCRRMHAWGRAGWAGTRAVAGGARAAVERVPALLARAQQAGERAREHGRCAARVLREVLCGALVGVMLGVLAGWQTGAWVEYAPLGALVGGVLGLIVGGSRREPARPAEG